MNIRYEEIYKGKLIQVVYDFSADDPREWDNLGTLACFHARKSLGDEDVRKLINSRGYHGTGLMLHILLYEFEKELYNLTAYKRAKKLADKNGEYLDIEDWINENSLIEELFYKFHFCLPVYAYEHGSIIVDVKPVSYDIWDSGQLGIIYVSKTKALKDFGQTKVTKKFEKAVYGLLTNEVKIYNAWLNNATFGYNILSNGEVIESCYGFYPGFDGKPDYQFCLDEARQVVDYMEAQ